MSAEKRSGSIHSSESLERRGSLLNLGYTVGERLALWAREDGGRPAFVFRGTQMGNQRVTLTRGEVFDLSLACCHQLNKMGVEAGHVVCNTLPNSPERVVTDMAIMLAGAATMNGMLNLADGNDLAKSLTRGKVFAMVVDPTRHPNALDILGDRVITKGENARSRIVPNLQKMFCVNCGGGSELRPWLEHLKYYQDHHQNKVSPKDVAMYFNAAGSLAFSRLVPKTHREFISMGEALYDIMGIRRGETVFNNCSLGWYNGSCCNYVGRGSVRVLVDMTVPPIDLLEFSWETFYAEQCTVFFLLPPAISTSLIRPRLWAEKKHGPSTIITGGMPVSKRQVVALGLMCESMVITQSSAETGFMTQLKLNGCSQQHYQDGDYGDPIRGCQIRLTNTNSLEILPSEAGQPGQVEVKGPQVSRGCRSMFTVDGWMSTGNVAFYNAQQRLQAVCRDSEAIIHGPYLIYPTWLEKKLEECPGVEKVVIVPVPDSRMFQEMCACIEPLYGEVVAEADFKAFCQTLFVADVPLECLQIPKYFLLFPDFSHEEGSQGALDRTKIFHSALRSLKLSLALL